MVNVRDIFHRLVCKAQCTTNHPINHLHIKYEKNIDSRVAGPFSFSTGTSWPSEII